jgi:hypothetical protein
VKRLALITALGLLAACSNPTLGLGLNFDASGMSITPALSGQIGAAQVTVSG